MAADVEEIVAEAVVGEHDVDGVDGGDVDGL